MASEDVIELDKKISSASSMFDRTASEIFQEAGVPVQGKEQHFHHVADAQGTCMAFCSDMYGMSQARFDAYAAERQHLFQELIELRNAGKLQA